MQGLQPLHVCNSSWRALQEPVHTPRCYARDCRTTIEKGHVPILTVAVESEHMDEERLHDPAGVPSEPAKISMDPQGLFVAKERFLWRSGVHSLRISYSQGGT